MTDSIQRFSTRVEDYVRYRPGYPVAIFNLLESTCNLTKDSVIADIGSGTGKLSELFLQNGNVVFGVEPNAAMRMSAERLLQGYDRFESIVGSAESTSLENNSVDCVTSGQAFHWFDRQRALLEFARILRPHGWVVLIWNERRVNATPFLRAYEDLLLKYGTDYQRVRHENVVGEIASFFAPGDVAVRSFDNLQEFDFEGLKGRTSSTSYIPEPGTAEFVPMLEALKEVFAKYATAGRVVFEYDTRVYFGRISH